MRDMESRMSRSLSSGARSRDPLAHPGYDHGLAFSRHNAPEFCKSFRPKNRGRRESRVHAAPAVSCAKMHIKKRTRAYRFSGGNPAFPAQWFYGLFRALPGETGLVCHRRPRDAKHHRELDTSHWGVRTTRLRRPRWPRSSVAATASIAPRPAFRDDCAYAPLVGRDGARSEGDLPSRSSSTAATHWHDGQIKKCVSSFIC